MSCVFVPIKLSPLDSWASVCWAQCYVYLIRFERKETKVNMADMMYSIDWNKMQGIIVLQYNCCNDIQCQNSSLLKMGRYCLILKYQATVSKKWFWNYLLSVLDSPYFKNCCKEKIGGKTQSVKPQHGGCIVDGDVQRGSDTAEQTCVLFASQNC